jgi:hypothetical protein
MNLCVNALSHGSIDEIVKVIVRRVAWAWMKLPMPSPLNTLFNVLILVLQWQSKRPDGTKRETWNALLQVTNELSLIKERKKRYQPSMEKFNIVSRIPNAPKSKFESLPAELITMILHQITDQNSLYKLSLLNRRWNRLLKLRLFVNPYLTSPYSIQSFMKSLNDVNGKQVAKLEFGPTSTGCLSDPDIVKDHFHFIPFVHSGLFRLLIHDREHINTTEHLVHPLFYSLAEKLPNCSTFEEFGYHKETINPKEEQKFYTVPGRSFKITRIPSSSMNLTFLLRACQKWIKESPEWDGLKACPTECLATCTLLLTWLQGEYHPIWHRVGGDAVRHVKPLINSLVRSFLAHIYSTLLLQVRFITGNSQRLLDCYCLIYYRVLSIAQGLDVMGLAEAMGCPKPNESNIVTTSQFLLHQQQEMLSEAERSLSEVLLEAKDSLTPRSSQSSVASVALTTNQDAARNVYECLILIFHFRIPANLHSSKTFPRVPAELLKEILITFPPSTINAETVELITRLLQHPLDPQDPTTPLLETWYEWLRELVQWHDASKEMEPVKELLRKSMSKIDQLRAIQVLSSNFSDNTGWCSWISTSS